MMHQRPLNLAGVCYVCRNLRPADIREIEATRYGDLDPDELAMEIIRSWSITGNAWLVYHNDKPVAIFGATNPWPGMWSAFMLATPDFPKIALPLTKFVKRVFIPHMKLKANRVEARSIDGHGEAHRWLGALGATVEGRLKGYGRDGEDFLVFTLALDSDAVTFDTQSNAA